MKYLFSRFVALCLMFSGISCVAIAGAETVEIAKVQVAKSLSGIVHDSNGAPVVGATVSEISADGKIEIQSTVTDSSGHFALPTAGKSKIHHLKITMKNFNPLLVHVKLNRWTARFMDLQLHVST